MPTIANEDQKIKELASATAVEEDKVRVVSGDEKRKAFIDVTKPEVLKAQSLNELVQQLGEDMIMNKVLNQLIIDFRSQVRGKMESFDNENESFRYDLNEIEGADYLEWKPEARQRKSLEEKAAEILAKLSPDQIKAAQALASGNK